MSEDKFKAPELPKGWVWEVTIVKTDWDYEHRAEVKAIKTATNAYIVQRIQFSLVRDSSEEIRGLFAYAAESLLKDIPVTDDGILAEIAEAFNNS